MYTCPSLEGGILNKRLVQNDPHAELHSQGKRKTRSCEQLRATMIDQKATGGQQLPDGEGTGNWDACRFAIPDFQRAQEWAMSQACQGRVFRGNSRVGTQGATDSQSLGLSGQCQVWYSELRPKECVATADMYKFILSARYPT